VEGYVVVTRIRHINIVQWALVSGLIYAALGLIIGLFWIPFAALMTAVSGGMTHGSGMMGAGLGLFAIIVFPILYFVLGFVFGIIFAALYNLVAGWTGGVEMKLDTVASTST
jgi:hypothetical protein